MSENVMQAISIGDGGAPENLTLQDHPMPQPAEGEILVRLGAAGVNRLRAHPTLWGWNLPVRLWL